MNCINSEMIMLKSSYMLIFTFPWENLTFSLLDMREEPEVDVFCVIILLHVVFFLCINTPDCQVFPMHLHTKQILYIMYHKHWVSKPILTSHWGFRTLFRLAKIIFSKNDNTISGFLRACIKWNFV